MPKRLNTRTPCHVRVAFISLVTWIGACAGSGNGAAGGNGGAPGNGGAITTGGTADGTPTAGGGTSGGGVTATGGATGMGGVVATGGAPATGGATGKGGNTATGGTTTAIGTKATGGTASTGGTKGTGGMPATGGTTSPAGTGGSTSGTCGPSTLNLHPFGCNFAWGIADPGSASYANYSYVQFMSQWAGSNIKADGTFPSFSNSSWLTKLSSTNIIPAYYAYIIGYYGHVNGLPDQNVSPNGANLSTGGAALITANYGKIISAYAWYAQQTYAVWKTKPLVWLLEGDFVQYSTTSQSAPLSYAKLSQLAADITCAIKTNMPNAIVAINHSPWNADEVTNSFWNAMKVANYDMVWTTGLGDNNGFIPANTSATSYNGKTATYAYLHNLTGKYILVDTSAGASARGDSWSTTASADLNSRMSEGVIAANITGTPPNNLQSNISGLALNPLSSCP
jgi:hypothetical protein